MRNTEFNVTISIQNCVFNNRLEIPFGHIYACIKFKQIYVIVDSIWHQT